jgi:hypothetical protein
MPLMEKTPLNEHTRQQVEERLAEGWPVSECIKSGLITKWMAARHFKGRGWTSQQAGAYSQSLQRIGATL